MPFASKWAVFLTVLDHLYFCVPYPLLRRHKVQQYLYISGKPSGQLLPEDNHTAILKYITDNKRSVVRFPVAERPSFLRQFHLFI